MELQSKISDVIIMRDNITTQILSNLSEYQMDFCSNIGKQIQERELGWLAHARQDLVQSYNDLYSKLRPVLSQLPEKRE